MKFSQDENKDLLIKLGLSVAAFVFGKEMYSKYKKGEAESSMDTDPASTQAAAINTAFNPSGFSWLRAVDGTKKETLMAIAPQITELDKVAERYKALTEGRNLYDDLQAELSADDLQKFNSLATKGKTGSWYYAPKSEKVPANLWVVTIADANVRRTPVAQHRLTFNNNIVLSAPKGRMLGGTTGKFAYDEANKVLFIEFFTIRKSDRKRATYFVAKSQVELITKQVLEEKRKKDTSIELQLLDGVPLGEVPTQEVVAIGPTKIFDEKFKLVGRVNDNTVIGFPLMTLDTGNGKHIQIKTIQGLLRWVRADQVQTRERLL